MTNMIEVNQRLDDANAELQTFMHNDHRTVILTEDVEFIEDAITYIIWAMEYRQSEAFFQAIDLLYSRAYYKGQQSK